MVVAVINEGFSNQLYRYCAAYSASRILNTGLVLIVQTTRAISDPFQLSEFRIVCSELITTNSQIETLQTIWDLEKTYDLIQVNEKNYFATLENVIKNGGNGIILNGHFQNVAFFSLFIDELKPMLTFENKSTFLDDFIKKIENKQSVGVHIRRGDFLYYSSSPSATMDYYKSAMCYMYELVGDRNLEFFVFSDDIEYVREKLGNSPQIHYVCNYGGFRESIEEFFALKSCNHHILNSASSFSRAADLFKLDCEGFSIYEDSAFSNAYILQNEKTIILQKENYCSGKEKFRSVFCSNMQLEIVKENACKNENQLRLGNILIDITNKNYDVALGKLRKYWDFVFERNNEEEQEMHNLFFECLLNKGLYQESLIEASFVDNTIIEKYRNEELVNSVNEIARLKERNVHFFIIPYRNYNSMWYEDMVNFGIIVRRMGFNVTFLFHEGENDGNTNEAFNRKLHKTKEFVKTRGYRTFCGQDSLDRIENECLGLTEYLNSLDEEQEYCFFVKERKILDEIYSSKLKNKKTVFWDFFDFLDAGAYKQTGDIILPNSFSAEDVDYCCENSDYVITTAKGKKSIKNLIAWNNVKSNVRETIADYESFDDDFIKNVFNILFYVL